MTSESNGDVVTVTFESLWKNHATRDDPCSKDGKSNFSDQCAIRVGVALAKSGYDVTQLKRGGMPRFCWHHTEKEGHILAAEELANALDRTRIPGISATFKVDQNKDFADVLNGKKGIIFFKDYWARGGETTHRTGDHIDLWNGYKLPDLISYFRIQWGLSFEGFMTDFRKSKEVWFWEVR